MKMHIKTKVVLVFGQWMFLLGALLPFAVFGQSRPNVILVLTDDQGIGDLGGHGNPWLKTPNIDAFYDDAVRLTNFHASPLCTPTRAALMTGQYPIHNGAWATFKGRDALSDPKTMADVFKGNGYATAMFGKWHLGDNYPNRPTDSGFEYAIQHLSGGIGELSDYWGNDYFDDVYYVNNEPEQFEGYCTDVWFREAMDYIKEQKERPFFVYLPLNAPHDPLYVDEKYAAPYRHLEGREIVSADLYGMIANIDENFGKLTRFLDKEGLAGNTIVIYMSDNGTRFGYTRDGKLGYNKGFSGIKGDKLEGGHRVPFFVRWPQGKIKGGKDVDQLAAHVDVLPTLASLCNLELGDFQGDGIDLSAVLKRKEKRIDRQLFLHNRQDWRPPEEGRDGLVLEGEWRLIQGEKLYNIEDDPLQQRDVAPMHGDRVGKLRRANARFYARATKNKEFSELPTTAIGSDEQRVVKLTIQHAIGEDVGIWKTEQVAAGVRNKNNTHALDVVEPGLYKISCMRWPKEIPGPIRGVPDPLPDQKLEYRSISPEKARVSIANQMMEKGIGKSDQSVDFVVKLEKGKTFLVADFMEGDEKYGVYYLYLEKLDRG